jgi:hypothetical protein
MSYTVLVAAKSTDGSIKNFANSDTVPSTIILAEAEQWIARRLRVRQMLTATSGTMTASATAIDLPSDYVWPRRFAITGVNQGLIKKQTLETVEGAFSYDGSGNRVLGKPGMYYADATQAVFDQMADQAYPYRLNYFRQLPALSTATTTNFLTQRAPRLLRAACLWAANDFLKNAEERAYWAKVAMDEIAELNIESDMEEFRGADESLEVS